jgi:CheY-like chemotaxis protein
VPRTILVVDDEKTLRETLADGLESEGYSVAAGVPI